MTIFLDDKLKIIFKHGNETGLKDENNEEKHEELKKKLNV
jgi:hypothetical protein